MKHYSYFIIYLLLNRLATSVATPVLQTRLSNPSVKPVSNSLKGKTVRDPLVGSRIVRGTCGGGALMPSWQTHFGQSITPLFVNVLDCHICR